MWGVRARERAETVPDLGGAGARLSGRWVANRVDAHMAEARVHGKDERRLTALGAWRESPYISDRSQWLWTGARPRR